MTVLPEIRYERPPRHHIPMFAMSHIVSTTQSCQAPKSVNSLVTRGFLVSDFPSKPAMLDIEARN
jgi:hypothetical protein